MSSAAVVIGTLRVELGTHFWDMQMDSSSDKDGQVHWPKKGTESYWWPVGKKAEVLIMRFITTLVFVFLEN